MRAQDRLVDQVASLLGWRLGATQADHPLLRLRREPLGLDRLAYRLVS